jgi:hypothetical protein
VTTRLLLEPVVTEQLDRMWRADGLHDTLAAGTKPIATICHAAPAFTHCPKRLAERPLQAVERHVLHLGKKAERWRYDGRHMPPCGGPYNS